MTKAFRFTLAGGSLALVVLAFALSGFHLAKLEQSIVDFFEWYRVDDVILGLCLILAGIIIDRVLVVRSARRREAVQAQRLITLKTTGGHEAGMQSQRLMIMKATMLTMQQVTNNLLRSVQRFRNDAEGLVPAESLELLDNTVQETTEKLRELGDLEVVPLQQTAIGIGIDSYITPSVGLTTAVQRLISQAKNSNGTAAT